MFIMFVFAYFIFLVCAINAKDNILTRMHTINTLRMCSCFLRFSVFMVNFQLFILIIEYLKTYFIKDYVYSAFLYKYGSPIELSVLAIFYCALMIGNDYLMNGCRRVHGMSDIEDMRVEDQEKEDEYLTRVADVQFVPFTKTNAANKQLVLVAPADDNYYKNITKLTPVEKATCSICLEDVEYSEDHEKSCLLICNHLYHFKCIQEWFFVKWSYMQCNNVKEIAANLQKLTLKYKEDAHINPGMLYQSVCPSCTKASYFALT